MASSSQQNVQCFPHGYRMVVPCLRAWYHGMSDDDQAAFKSRFGYLPSTLTIEPREEVVLALLPFWDSLASVFRFGEKHEMTPLLEEYGRLLGVGHGGTNIVTPKFNRNFKRKLSDFLGLKRTMVEPNLNIDQGTCSISFLINSFSTIAGLTVCQNLSHVNEELWWGRRPLVLALCLFSTLLFPRADGEVDLRLIDVVLAVQAQKAIVPMILAETYRSLNRCTTGRSTFFSGAAILLQVWALEHICGPTSIIYHCWFDYDLFEKQNQRLATVDLPTDTETLIEHLKGCSWNDLHWFSGWANSYSAVLRCSELPFLPLIGLNGVVPYAPSRVIRQFGWKQTIPQVQDMSFFSLDYGADAETKCLDNVLKLWKNQEVYKCPEDERDHIDDTTVLDYDTWLVATLDGNPMKEAISLMGCAPPTSDGYVDYVTEMSARHRKITTAYLNDEKRMEEEIRQLKAQLEIRSLEVVNTTAELDRANALIEYVDSSLAIVRDADDGNSMKSLKMYRQSIDNILEVVQGHNSS